MKGGREGGREIKLPLCKTIFLELSQLLSGLFPL